MSRVSTSPSRTLVFNPLKRLVAIVQSNTAAAKLFDAKVQGIHYACTGKCMSCKGLYFRSLDNSIEVTLDDLGVLKLDEYDELCGIERKTYENKTMSRKGMKYNKTIKDESTSSKQIRE